MSGGEPERRGWHTVDGQGRRSSFSDSPDLVPGGVPSAEPDSARFDEVVSFELDAEERQMLVHALSDLGGPAGGSDALAVALGFADNLGVVAGDHRSGLAPGPWCRRGCRRRPAPRRAASPTPWTVREWTRSLVATEIAFASDVLGTGVREWTAMNDRDPQHELEVLQRLQAKLPRDSAALGS